MRRVYTAADLPDAHIVLGLLHQQGIAAQVLGEHARGGVGELPFAETYPEVWVERDEDFDRALAVVRGYEAAQPDTGEVRCAVCGESSPAHFGVCWNCGAKL